MQNTILYDTSPVPAKILNNELIQQNGPELRGFQPYIVQQQAVINQCIHKIASESDIKKTISPGIFLEFGYFTKLQVMNIVHKNANGANSQQYSSIQTIKNIY
ncbi:unnamed protein product [Paramecium sonneborni]|uniref:Uncharacterized protein n=1 Tax=Paramecium sonneborni TaxID=65129 RepID=A0A8S1Q8T4_9CILI|nr:unnamed protein product [Paramecium sonneborni]